MLATGDILSNATTVAEGFQKYGPLVWALSLTIVALVFVFAALLLSKGQQIDREAEARKRAEDRAETAEAQLLMTQERRFTDVGIYNDKLAALARETNLTIDRSTAGYFQLERAVLSKIPEPKKRAAVVDEPNLPQQALKEGVK